MITEKEKEHFLGNVIANDADKCWEWKLAKDGRGYGVVGYRKKQFRTHRVMWYIINGKIPPGLLICHHCDNPSCVNPNHLFLGTAYDNMRDKINKGRARYPGRPKGFSSPGMGKNFPEKQFGEYNPSHKLTWLEIDSIRYEWFSAEQKRGLISKLAKKYNISYMGIKGIVKFKGWNKREIKGEVIDIDETYYLSHATVI